MKAEEARELAEWLNSELELSGGARFSLYHACGENWWLSDPMGRGQYIFANPNKTREELLRIAKNIVASMRHRQKREERTVCSPV